MKHTEWLRLHTEGEKICAILRQKGYHCQKQARRLSWWVSKEDSDSYVLTYLPSPVGEWSVIPKTLKCNALFLSNTKPTSSVESDQVMRSRHECLIVGSLEQPLGRLN